MTNFIIGALLNPFFASTPNSAGPSHSYEHDTISLLAAASKSIAWVLTAIDFTLLMSAESRRAVT